jgi:hypothetical protein
MSELNPASVTRAQVVAAPSRALESLFRTEELTAVELADLFTTQQTPGVSAWLAQAVFMELRAVACEHTDRHFFLALPASAFNRVLRACFRAGRYALPGDPLTEGQAAGVASFPTLSPGQHDQPGDRVRSDEPDEEIVWQEVLHER